MSVSIYTGATGRGKSFHVLNHVAPKWKKTIVFDPKESFRGDCVVYNPTDSQLLAIYKKFKDKDSFRIVIRTTRDSNDELIFNKTAHLACALGRHIPGKVDEEFRVQFFIDEASTSGIMTAHRFPPNLQNLVCKGRHDNVDTHFIAQNPMAVHNQIREQVTKIVTFYLNSGRAPLFQDSFSRENAMKIPRLPKYWRMEWTDDGNTFVYNEKNEIDENFLRKSEEIPKKKRVK